MEAFADYSQWDAWQRSQTKALASDREVPRRASAAVPKGPPAATRSKLSFNDAREFAAIEARLAQAESELQASINALEDPASKSDHLVLQSASARVAEAQKTLESLYARWAELEEKKG